MDSYKKQKECSGVELFLSGFAYSKAIKLLGGLSLSLLCAGFLLVSTADIVCADMMYDQIKKIAQACYPNEKVIGYHPTARLGKDKVTYGAEIYLSNRIEMHFVTRSEEEYAKDGSRRLSSTFIDEVECIENGQSVPCPCDIVVDRQSSSSAGESEPDYAPVKKGAGQSIDIDQLGNHVGEAFQIRMKTGVVHKNAIITKVTKDVVAIDAYKYGGKVMYKLAKEKIENVSR